jgi:hypothetical protein
VTPGAGREPLFAAIIVEVVADDVTDVNLILRPGGGISGRVTLEPETAAPADLAGARVRAPLVEDEGIDEAAAGAVAADGTFDIRGLPAGGRYLTVDGLPAALVLKRIEYRQQDITDLVIDVKPGDVFRDLRVVVTDRASEVRGTVRNNSGDPVPGALVVVLPASATFWTRANRRVRAVRTDGVGRYVIRGLPPGQYRAFASIELGEENLYRGEPLGPLIAAAEPLAIAADTVRTLDLPLSIPARPLSSSR